MEEPNSIMRGYRVRGRVQGVGFRWWTLRTAAGLGLAGYVRNLADGTVEVHAAGRADELARLETALGRGPMGARVSGVESIEPDASMPRESFTIGR